jgi:tetratricopeptide (TPR) repeat protein
MKAARLIVPGLVMFGLLAGLTPSWAGWTVRARLERAVGVVKLQRAGEWHTLSSAMQYDLYAGDHLQTLQKSSATVLIDGTSVRLAPRTHVMVPDWKRVSGGAVGPGQAPSGLWAVAGKVWVWLVGTRTFELGSEGAVAGASGTKFIVEVDDTGQTTLTVIEGQVNFHNDKGAVLVAASEQSTARAGVAPSRPRRVDVTGEVEFEAALDNLGLGLEMRYNPAETPERLRQLLGDAKAAATASPNDAVAQLRLGDLLNDTGDLLAAETAYRRAVELAPNDVNARTRLGYCLLQQSKVDDAGAVFGEVLKAAPGNAEALLGQAAALFSSSRPDSAAKATDLLRQATAATPPSAQAFVLAGFWAMRHGEAAQARQSLEHALQLDPNNYQALAYLSAVQLAGGDGPGALTSARKAISIAPGSGLAHEALGTADFFTGDSRAAREEADLAISLRPDAATARLLSSDLYVAEGQLYSGLREAQLAVALDPELAPAYSALGMIFLSQGDLKQAQKAYARALELGPKLVAARTGMGVVYARQGELAKALELQKGAIALDSSAAAAHNNIGESYLTLGKLDLAEQEFREALRLQPDSGKALANLAQTYLDDNRLADASRHAELALAKGEDTAYVHTILAEVYLQENRTDKSWTELRRALSLDPNYALAHLDIAQVYLRQGRGREALKHQLLALAIQPAATVQSRQYARQEVQVAGGSFSGTVSVDGVPNNAEQVYHLELNHTSDNLSRLHTAYRQNTGVFTGGQTNSDGENEALFASVQHVRQDTPGRALGVGLLPEDPDDESRFLARDIQYLSRQKRSDRSIFNLRIGWADSSYTAYNPDSLLGDANPFRRLELASSGLQAEGRFDYRLGRSVLTLGAGLSGASDSISGLVGTAGAPPTFDYFRNKADHDAATLYLEHHSLSGRDTELILGGRLAAAEGITPVARPKLMLRKQTKSDTDIVLLTQPILANDVAALDPVNDWALADGFSPYDFGQSLSPTNFADGGFGQTYELQYQRSPLGGSTFRVSGFYRSLHNFIVDLQDPNWAAGLQGEIVGLGNVRGAEAAYNKHLSPNLSADAWFRYSKSENSDVADNRIPFIPRTLGQLRLTYEDQRGLEWWLAFVHTGRRFADFANTQELGSYSTFNMHLAKQFNLHTKAFIDVTDLFDRRPAFWSDYPTAGRRAKVGLKYRF